jgi:hypothetical protein
VLNDDLVVLLPDENLWRMYSTPFWNPTQVVPKQLGAVLTAIYYLIQDESVYAEPMKQGQALAELIANIPIISGNPDHSIGLIERGKEVFRRVPAYRLHFLPDDSFWRVIDNRSG